MAGEAVWCGGDGGLWRYKGWETSGSQTPTKTGIVRLADGLTGLSRNGSLLELGHYVRGEAWHCRSGAVCGGLAPTLSAPAAGTAASWTPGTLPAGFTPAEVWRNSGQV